LPLPADEPRTATWSFRALAARRWSQPITSFSPVGWNRGLSCASCCGEGAPLPRRTSSRSSRPSLEVAASSARTSMSVATCVVGLPAGCGYQVRVRGHGADIRRATSPDSIAALRGRAEQRRCGRLADACCRVRVTTVGDSIPRRASRRRRSYASRRTTCRKEFAAVGRPARAPCRRPCTGRTCDSPFLRLSIECQQTRRRAHSTIPPEPIPKKNGAKRKKKTKQRTAHPAGARCSARCDDLAFQRRYSHHVRHGFASSPANQPASSSTTRPRFAGCLRRRATTSGRGGGAAARAFGGGSPRRSTQSSRSDLE